MMNVRLLDGEHRAILSSIKKDGEGARIFETSVVVRDHERGDGDEDCKCYHYVIATTSPEIHLWLGGLSSTTRAMLVEEILIKHLGISQTQMVLEISGEKLLVFKGDDSSDQHYWMFPLKKGRSSEK